MSYTDTDTDACVPRYALLLQIGCWPATTEKPVLLRLIRHRRAADNLCQGLSVRYYYSSSNCLNTYSAARLCLDFKLLLTYSRFLALIRKLMQVHPGIRTQHRDPQRPRSLPARGGVAYRRDLGLQAQDRLPSVRFGWNRNADMQVFNF